MADFKWKYTGGSKPPFAAKPRPGQESVWDYPRPPRIVADRREILVRKGDLRIAARETYRILETAGPPTFYLPPRDVNTQLLHVYPGTSICEWKGTARYWSLESAREPIGWSYEAARPPYEAISGYFSFYPGRVECFVDGERVRPQPGYFYGGWVSVVIVLAW